jgi:hypothetical protein
MKYDVKNIRYFFIKFVSLYIRYMYEKLISCFFLKIKKWHELYHSLRRKETSNYILRFRKD